MYYDIADMNLDFPLDHWNNQMKLFLRQSWILENMLATTCTDRKLRIAFPFNDESPVPSFLTHIM